MLITIREVAQTAENPASFSAERHDPFDYVSLTRARDRLLVTELASLDDLGLM